jgi:AraC-like DNA-binding protein
VLHSRTILTRDDLEITDVACRHPRGRGGDEAYAGRHAVVFVRRGCFMRRTAGVDVLADPTVSYCMRPGEEQRVDHPHSTGDDCTAIFLDAGLAAALWGGSPELPAGGLRTSPALDLEHRLLVARAQRPGDPDELVERAIALVAAALATADAPRTESGRPATARARRALADGAREALAAEPGLGLPALARMLAVSPHHLSRVFHAETGETISRHRMRLRARAALEQLAAGERDLARLAAELGFADQSHLTRVLRSETGRTPAALRRALA